MRKTCKRGDNVSNNRKTTRWLYSGISYGFIIIACVISLVPILWMISTAFKPLNEVFTIPLKWLPSEPQFENFVLPFQERPFGRYFLNSSLVSTVVTLSNLFFCSLAAYGIAKYDFPFKRAVFIGILSVMMLPIEVRAVPLFLLMRSFGWVDNYLPLIVPDMITAFGIFIMHQYFLSVPGEFMDAARIDGSGEFHTFWRIMLPLCKPALSALAIFTFMGVWNDYFWPLIVISRDAYRTLPLGLAMFENVYNTQYNQVMAISLLASLPVLLLFTVMQKRFIDGMVMSGLKG